MSYEKVIISETLGDRNEFGKPTTFLGIMKENKMGFSEWTNTRREIVLAFGKDAENGSYYIGEAKKSGSDWIWVWGIPVADIHGYENLVKDIKDGE